MMTQPLSQSCWVMPSMSGGLVWPCLILGDIASLQIHRFLLSQRSLVGIFEGLVGVARHIIAMRGVCVVAVFTTTQLDSA